MGVIGNDLYEVCLFPTHGMGGSWEGECEKWSLSCITGATRFWIYRTVQYST